MSDRNYTFHPSVYQNWVAAEDSELADGTVIKAGTPLIKMYPHGIYAELLDGRVTFFEKLTPETKPHEFEQLPPNKTTE